MPGCLVWVYGEEVVPVACHQKDTFRCRSGEHELPEVRGDRDQHHLLKLIGVWVQSAHSLSCWHFSKDQEQGSGDFCWMHLPAGGDHPC